MVYDESNRDEFDECAQQELDALRRLFGSVEVIPPEQTLRDNRWFVQVRSRPQAPPIGVFGNSPLSAARRLRKVTRSLKD